MSRQAILRLLDTLFRRWWLYLVPVLLLAVVGYMQVKDAKKVYRSAGSISVMSGAPLLTTLDGRASDPGFGYDTPAGATAGNINSLIGTDSFAEAIAETAQIELSAAPGGITTAKIQQAVSAYPSGRTLVKVAAAHEDPEIARRLADATMKTYSTFVIAGERLDTQLAVNNLEERLVPFREEVARAEQALTDYVTANPAPLGEGSRPADQQAQMARLQSDLDRANQRVFDTENNLFQARLANEQVANDVLQQLRPVDEPRTPLGPQSNLKQNVITFGLFLFIGILLALAGVVLGTVADHSIRFPSDVRDRLGLRVLAVVPKAGSRRWTRLRGFVTTESARPAGASGTAAAAGRGAQTVEPTRARVAETVERPVVIPVASLNGEPAANGDSTVSQPEVHPAHRQRRRPGGTRPSVTLRKGN